MANRKIKQLLAIALTILISLSAAVSPVYADVTGDNGGGTGANVGTSTNYKKWSNNHTGYRFYLINSNLERVTPLYDFYFSQPTDVTEILKTTRFDTASSPNLWYSDTIQTFANMVGASVSDIPKPVANGQGHGREFRDFFLDGVAYTGGDNDIPIISSGGNSSSGSSSGSSSSSGTSTSPVSGDQSTYPNDVKTNVAMGQVISRISVSDAKRSLNNNEIIESYSKLSSAKSLYTIYIVTAPSYLTSAEKNQYALAKVYTALSKTDLTYKQKIYILALLNSGVAVQTAKFSTVSLLNQNIPMSDGGGSAAEKFLKDRAGIAISGFEHALDAMVEAGYLLCVEPITWIYVPSNGANYPAEGNKTYASWWGITKKWVEQGGPESAGFYGSIGTELFPNCMTLNSDLTTESGATLLAAMTAKRTMSQSLIDMTNTGLCLHVYSSADIGKKPEVITVESEWTLNESEISKPLETGTKTTSVEMNYTCGDLENCDGHAYCNHSCSNDCGTYLSCNSKEQGHEHGTDCYSPTCTHNCGGTCATKYCDKFTLTDSSYTFKLKNEKESNYSSIIALSDGFGTENNEISKTRSTTEEEEVTASGFNYKFVAYRSDDKLSYASYKNDLSLFGFNSSDSKSFKTRKDEDYSKNLSISLVDDSLDLITTSKGDEDCENEDEASSSTSIDYTGTVKIKTYSGKERQADKSENNDNHIRLTSLMNDMTRGRMVSTGTSIKFNPYIKMTYAGLDAVKHEVDVLGEYRREILPNDYAEISWNLEEDNLLVQSQMWMTDKAITNETDDLVWTGRNQVLKGGSLLNLVADDKIISVNTYQTIIPSSSRAISEISGSMLTEEEAIEAHEMFVMQGLLSLDNLELVQYVSKKVDGQDAWEDGIQVSSGSDISALKNTSDGKASDDAKYYLDSDVNNVKNIQRSDLDVYEMGTNVAYYRFYSDTSGNIYMVSGNSLSEVEAGVGSIILTKTQGISNLSDKALFLDNRTKVVTKLLAAIERNTGNDSTASWAPDGKWYNEAYSGVVILEQKTSIKVGLGVNNYRQLIIDPRLCPKSEGKSYNGSAAHATGFKVDADRLDAISTFKGTPVYMENPDMLFNSRTVYITNMTVQDNN